VQVVWELVSNGYFSQGVVVAGIVSAIAQDSMMSARIAAKLITNARNVSNTGIRMCNFMGRLYNMEGDHVETLDKAVCHLSHFSCVELEAAFHTQGGVLPFLCMGLTKRTLNKMTFVPHSEYKSFATDSLSLLLPLLDKRRERVGLPTVLRPNAFLEVLKTVPEVKWWHPTNGTLTLSIPDVKKGHVSLRGILDSLHERDVMVRRVCRSKKVTYEFDSWLLWELMLDHTSFLTP
jgi:hypothetical protein